MSLNEYETVCVLKPDLPQARLDKVRDKIKKIVEDNSAQVVDQIDWGKRKLAYVIDKSKFGHYLYNNFTGTGLVVSEIEKMLKYDENVIRYLTVKLADKADSGKKKVKKVSALEEGFTLQEQRPSRDGFDRRGDDYQEGVKGGDDNAKEKI